MWWSGGSRAVAREGWRWSGWLVADAAAVNLGQTPRNGSSVMGYRHRQARRRATTARPSSTFPFLTIPLYRCTSSDAPPLRVHIHFDAIVFASPNRYAATLLQNRVSPPGEGVQGASAGHAGTTPQDTSQWACPRRSIDPQRRTRRRPRQSGAPNRGCTHTHPWTAPLDEPPHAPPPPLATPPAARLPVLAPPASSRGNEPTARRRLDRVALRQHPPLGVAGFAVSTPHLFGGQQYRGPVRATQVTTANQRPSRFVRVLYV